MNILVLDGRIGNEIELKTTQSGTTYINFTLANTGRKVGPDKKTNWIPCVAYGKTAEMISNYFHKGDSIYLEGELDISSYENKDGKKMTSFSCSINKVHFPLGGNKTQETKPKDNAPKFEPISVDDEDMPF